jgi:hypothetical protein
MKRRTVAGAALSAVLVVACNAVLGIDEAQVDSTFHPTTAAAGGSLCNQYCTLMQQNCGDPQHMQYTSFDVCMKICPMFEPGIAGADEGNTLACRITHAGRAKSIDPNVHCPHAGPLGLGHCGDTCEGFCLVDVTVCGTKAYGSEQACLDQCKAKSSTSYSYVQGTGINELQSGNTINCRLYHLESAVDPEFTEHHCPHTAQDSATCAPASVDGGAGDAADAATVPDVHDANAGG